ncbi:MAG: dihydropteroate synthase [Alphaproteobacteria bacterium]|uniref:Dihydropteroate synthase n=1 Tax=Candidatus Nitrobium versatile TaxID=2884831 RepID=A0A953M141_9BACT|nr:dihydropteroate synthase [Candidatus Nitrobium versatile]
MEVIAERINTSIKYIEKAYEEKNARVIQEEATKQVEAGADIIDVNAGLKLENNVQRLEWAVDIVQEVTDIPLAVDSIHPKAIEAGLRRCREVKSCIANSITLQKHRINGILPFVKEMGCKVVGVTIDEEGGMPDHAEGRLEIAKRLAETVDRYGIDLSLLYIDFMCLPVSAPNWYRQSLTSLESLRLIKKELPQVKTMVNVSASTWNLPKRSLATRTLQAMLMASDLDAVLLNPLDRELMATIVAAQTMLGRDRDCAAYLAAYKEGRL